MKESVEPRVWINWFSTSESTNLLIRFVRRLAETASNSASPALSEMSTLLAEPAGAPVIELNLSMGIMIRLSALAIPPRSRMAATVSSCSPMGE